MQVYLRHIVMLLRVTNRNRFMTDNVESFILHYR